MQRRGEVVLEPLGSGLKVRNAGDDRGETVDVGCHRIEDQVAQPREDRQGRHGGDPEQRAGDERCTEHRDDAAAATLDDAGQPADVGAVDDGHEPAHAGDQECDDGAGDGRGDQHA